jgi:hypothetical protein
MYSIVLFLISASLLLGAWLLFSMLAPFGTTSSDWLQIFANIIMAYAITRIVNDDGKKKELFSLLLDQIEDALNIIEKQIETGNSTLSDIQHIIIPQFKAVTTRITAFQNVLPKLFGKIERYAKVHSALDRFNQQFTALRTTISEHPDDFTTNESNTIRTSETCLKICRIDLWKVRFSVFSWLTPAS